MFTFRDSEIALQNRAFPFLVKVTAFSAEIELFWSPLDLFRGVWYHMYGSQIQM